MRILIKLRLLILRKSPRFWLYHSLLIVPRFAVQFLVWLTRPEHFMDELLMSELRIFAIRLQSIIFSMCSGVFLILFVSDLQT